MKQTNCDVLAIWSKYFQKLGVNAVSFKLKVKKKKMNSLNQEILKKKNNKCALLRLTFKLSFFLKEN